MKNKINDFYNTMIRNIKNSRIMVMVAKIQSRAMLDFSIDDKTFKFWCKIYKLNYLSNMLLLNKHSVIKVKKLGNFKLGCSYKV